MSEAPKVAPVVKKKIEVGALIRVYVSLDKNSVADCRLSLVLHPQFGKKEPTEAETTAQSMDEMFAKAKMDDDSDEEKRIKGDEEWSD